VRRVSLVVSVGGSVGIGIAAARVFVAFIQDFRAASRLAEKIGDPKEAWLSLMIGGNSVREFGSLSRCRRAAAAGRLFGGRGSCSSCV
jgi:hypothetical protein